MLTRHLQAFIIVMAALAAGSRAALMAQAPDDTSSELKLFEFEQIEMGVEFRARVYACDFEVANNA